MSQGISPLPRSSGSSLTSNEVIGIAGTDAKCRWVEKLGADVCLNYKSPSFKADLTKETDSFVEVYFGSCSVWYLSDAQHQF